MPLKQDGVDPDRVHGDEVYWIQDNGRGTTYVPFTKQDWDRLHLGKAKL